MSETSLNGTIYDFLVDHSVIEKRYTVLNIHEY